MEGAPSEVDSAELIADLQSISGVVEIHHLNVWELDEPVLYTHLTLPTIYHV